LIITFAINEIQIFLESGYRFKPVYVKSGYLLNIIAKWVANKIKVVRFPSSGVSVFTSGFSHHYYHIIILFFLYFLPCQNEVIFFLLSFSEDLPLFFKIY